jgi:hypothetical protein
VDYQRNLQLLHPLHQSQQLLGDWDQQLRKLFPYKYKIIKQSLKRHKVIFLTQKKEKNKNNNYLRKIRVIYF